MGPVIEALTEIQDCCPVERYRDIAREALALFEKLKAETKE